MKTLIVMLCVLCVALVQAQDQYKVKSFEAQEWAVKNVAENAKAKTDSDVVQKWREAYITVLDSGMYAAKHIDLRWGRYFTSCDIWTLTGDERIETITGREHTWVYNATATKRICSKCYWHEAIRLRGKK